MTSPNALMALLQQKKQELNFSDRKKTVTVPSNTSRWRILPGWSKEKSDFFHDFGLHYIKGADGKVKSVYVCVDKTYGKPCSICNAVETAINHTDDEQMKELLAGARSSKRVLLNALHLDGKEPTTPVILEIPASVFRDIIIVSEEWEGRTISIEKDAVDLTITKTGTGRTSTKYTVGVSPKSTKVDPSVMDKITNLDEYVAQENEAQANRALTSIASIAGILPPTSAPARPALPQTAALRQVAVEDMTEVIEEVDEELQLIEAAESAPATVAQAAPEPTGDSELDAMMKELGM